MCTRERLSGFLFQNYPDPNLSHCEVHTLDLSELTLERLRLDSAHLYQIVAQDATLLDFSCGGGTTIVTGDFTSAQLPRAVFEGLTCHHHVRFVGAILTGADFRSADLRSADLEDADLSEAFFQGAKLGTASLKGVRSLASAALTEVVLNGAILEQRNLSNANLIRARLNKARLIGASLLTAQLQGAELRDAQLQGADLTGANLSEADLSGADLRGTILTNVILQKTNLTEVVVDAQTSLVDVDLSSAMYDPAILTVVRYTPAPPSPEAASLQGARS